MALSAKLRAPGWYRAALYDVLGFAFAFGLVVLIRWLMHQHPVIDGRAITIVAMIAAMMPHRIRIRTKTQRAPRRSTQSVLGISRIQ